MVTITGYPFSDVTTDNNVNIGSTECTVITTSASKITCRTRPRTTAADETFPISELLLVFLKASEEA